VPIAVPLIGDLSWLFYQDRFGMFRISSALVDDYRYRGNYPIKPNNTSTRIIELIIDDMNTGKWPNVKDRDSTYLRCLGWSLRQIRSLTGTHINHSFAKYFHRFIQLAVVYYSEKQVAVAIRGAARTLAPPSFATEAAIRDTLNLLIKSFDHFGYGTNQRNTVRGIRSILETLALIQDLHDDIGIPTNLDTPEKYIPAAYDILVLKQPISAATKSKYLAHLDLSKSSRTLLNQITSFIQLDMDQTIGTTNRTRLSLWLDNAEPLIEKYRSAYKVATGTDLGKITPGALQELSQIRL
jgi:hypothetical protein